MAGRNLRQRKKNGPVPTPDPTPPHETQVDGATSLLTWIMYGVAVIILACLVYRLPVIFPSLPQYSYQKHLRGVRADAVPTFTADEERRDAIMEAFKHAWTAYERDAMGDDEYHPISKKGTNLSDTGSIGYTVIDAIDTMLIMGLDNEYQRAKTWIQEKLSFDRNANYNTFETTIRAMGGLLSAYHLSMGEPVFLEKARELGDRILPVFDTPTGLPLSMVNLHLREGVQDVADSGYVSTAEAATLQLEFRYLAFLTEDNNYWEKAEKVMAVLKAATLPHGLVPIFVSPKTGSYGVSPVRLGSRGDSYYEYLIKQYLQTNQTEGVYREMYQKAMTGIHTYLVQRSIPGNLLNMAELIPVSTPDGKIGWRLLAKQDHLVCFLGGSLMLGATTAEAVVEHVSVPPLPRELSAHGRRDWLTGVELIKTCLATYDTRTGLSPEIAHFRTESNKLDVDAGGKLPADWYIKGPGPGMPVPLDARYILRPETIESLFVAFRLTGDSWYRDQGWAIFQAIEKHCRIPSGGYASVMNVDKVPVQLEDRMETFMMGETLKYLYLLFSDASVLPLSDYVFNTEAHPLPIFVPTIRTGFS
ncbi:glycoside hydrolase family 47 protein [Scleroderma citrinum Foug A]|uniref:alpha-1,2-Mannosidase n=1 Tax=Scleroderma citrinum Foug A TaxID=1036808 RepID=A0A0C3EP91_9AGAM|nr:glycoside hydrolase family 47 protein [Scleroderma citrinum Foug A]